MLYFQTSRSSSIGNHTFRAQINGGIQSTVDRGPRGSWFRVLDAPRTFCLGTVDEQRPLFQEGKRHLSSKTRCLTTPLTMILGHYKLCHRDEFVKVSESFDLAYSRKFQ